LAITARSAAPERGIDEKGRILPSECSYVTFRYV
jgi:hypothetical protein